MKPILIGGIIESMLTFGLNHMTVPALDAEGLLEMAKALGCAGVEFRNDLHRPLFEGRSPEDVRAMVRDHGLRVFALAEVKAFNDMSAGKASDALALIKIAEALGAEGVALIPLVGSAPLDRAVQKDMLRKALTALRPLLENHGITGLIEPLGFTTSTLRYKSDVVEVLGEFDNPACFKIVHDTFHHHLAGDADLFADHTALVHVSGVTDPDVATDDMDDAYRVLVDASDRLGNITQLRALRQAGFNGPVSVESFAPEIHQLSDPATALAGSYAFISAQISGVPA